MKLTPEAIDLIAEQVGNTARRAVSTATVGGRLQANNGKNRREQGHRMVADADTLVDALSADLRTTLARFVQED